MSHKRTFISTRDKVKRLPKPKYVPCHVYVTSLSLDGSFAELHKMTFNKAGRVRGGSVVFRVLSQDMTPLKISLPNGESWTIPVSQGRNTVKFNCPVKKGSKLVFEIGGTVEIRDAYIWYEFAEGAK